MSEKQNIRVDLNHHIRGLKKSATLAMNEKAKELISQGKKVYKLGFGQSPFPVPEPVVESLQLHAREKDYLAVKGLLPLREAIAAYYQRKHQVNSAADHILIGPGSKELLFLLQLVYDGDLVIPAPSWVSYSPQALIVGKRVDWIQTQQENDWLLTAEELESFCKQDPERRRILILNYPSNPTGATFAVDRLKEIAEIARKYKMILLSDEIYGELHHTGQHVSIARFYPEGTIISSGLSKWCGAGGWRLGFFVFPKELSWLMDAMSIVASETFTSTSAPIQYAAVAAFQENPLFDQYLQDAQRILRIIAQTVYTKLIEHKIFCPKPQGGFYLFPDFSWYKEGLLARGIIDNRTLCDQLLEDTGVALLPSSDFGQSSEALSARLSFVDFDGARAMEIAQTTYKDKALDQPFMKECCGDLLEATDKIISWVKG